MSDPAQPARPDRRARRAVLTKAEAEAVNNLLRWVISGVSGRGEPIADARMLADHAFAKRGAGMQGSDITGALWPASSAGSLAYKISLLEGEIRQLRQRTEEAEAALDAKDATIAALRAEVSLRSSTSEHEQMRADLAEAELEQWRACFGETALAGARGVLAELEQLRKQAGLVQGVRDHIAHSKQAAEDDPEDYPVRSGNGVYADAYEWVLAKLDHALDQGPAEEAGGR